jgi:hypothetical protein
VTSAPFLENSFAPAPPPTCEAVELDLVPPVGSGGHVLGELRDGDGKSGPVVACGGFGPRCAIDVRSGEFCRSRRLYGMLNYSPSVHPALCGSGGIIPLNRTPATTEPVLSLIRNDRSSPRGRPSRTLAGGMARLGTWVVRVYSKASQKVGMPVTTVLCTVSGKHRRRQRDF